MPDGASAPDARARAPSTSPSSWTATAAGPSCAAARAGRATSAAPSPCAPSSPPPARTAFQALTLYAFSVQNWGRPKDEVEHLMTLLLDYLVEERDTILDNGIRLQGIGETDRLPAKVRDQLRFLESSSRGLHDMTLTLALSYGGREEIVEVCRRIAEDAAAGRLRSDQIDEEVIDGYMFTRDLPPLDLLIRTSGEMRLSNFLLWQSAYAEIVVTETLWPDFREAQFFECIEVFRGRQRRYGRVADERPASRK
jgi:undecaprenyl diphosphate synthase